MAGDRSLNLSVISDSFTGEMRGGSRWAVFARHGGVSTTPYQSLNVSYGVGDRTADVGANRRRIKDYLGINNLLSARQVHGAEIYHLRHQLQEDLEVDGYDALITDQSGIGLMVQQADCQAILLYDPHQRVMAAVHCGWRGSVSDILGTTVASMENTYGTDPQHLQVVISPSLGPCCAEFVNYQKELPEWIAKYMVAENHFDFWRLSRDQLAAVGLMSENVRTIGLCTRCNTDFFSYRRASRQGDGTTGRFCSVIVMEEE